MIMDKHISGTGLGRRILKSVVHVYHGQAVTQDLVFKNQS